MSNTINPELRFEICNTFSRWIAFSGTRSGCPLKSRKNIYPLIDAVVFDEILKSDQPISKQEFNDWHRQYSELITQIEPRLPIGWATKLINLYLKSMVYVGLFGRPELVKHIHPPIDGGLWDGIKEKYGDKEEIVEKTHSKTKIKDIVVYDDYRLIIDGIELISNKENWLLIEVEKLWKGTEF
jgi:hypothetical protein